MRDDVGEGVFFFFFYFWCVWGEADVRIYEIGRDEEVERERERKKK